MSVGLSSNITTAKKNNQKWADGGGPTVGRKRAKSQATPTFAKKKEVGVFESKSGVGANQHVCSLSIVSNRKCMWQHRYGWMASIWAVNNLGEKSSPIGSNQLL